MLPAGGGSPAAIIQQQKNAADKARVRANNMRQGGLIPSVPPGAPAMTPTTPQAMIAQQQAAKAARPLGRRMTSEGGANLSSTGQMSAPVSHAPAPIVRSTPRMTSEGGANLTTVPMIMGGPTVAEKARQRGLSDKAKNFWGGAGATALVAANIGSDILNQHVAANEAQYRDDFSTYLANRGTKAPTTPIDSTYSFLTQDLYVKPKESDYLDNLPSASDATKGVIASNALNYGLQGLTAGGSIGEAVGKGAAKKALTSAATNAAANAGAGAAAGAGAGPIGAVIGAIVGTVGGVVSGIIQKNQAKKLDKKAREEALDAFYDDLEQWRLKRSAASKRRADIRTQQDLGRREQTATNLNNIKAAQSLQQKQNILGAIGNALTSSGSARRFGPSTVGYDTYTAPKPTTPQYATQRAYTPMFSDALKRS